MKQIEVNGMVLEFDEKLILKQEIKVGDNVNLLKKSYSSYNVYKGVVTAILPFNDDVVAIDVLYIEESYGSFEVKTQTVMADVTGESDKDNPYKIIKIYNDADFIPFTKDRALDVLDKKILECENALNDAKAKKAYFLKYYNKYFKDTENE